ncbi:NAD-dependent epimerase/dehydratase family protein [Atopobacter sp. AH10]|uniref:NAD-dependent epimerase/dehydratase family protein n=1 Tax=Atopobacter sp. AH10 TaxID=2315861 RepID=UPI000EF213CE|nr:NAD-dependent epimerase/dehydratase family protein [Atopobacter sp. AH10]RLK63785.1 NAD-dependent epimerase/dehydratase family protein [Atopobacter sp. AH10]
MKKILITGKDSYLGDRFVAWMSQWPDQYQTQCVSLKDSDWQNQDWSDFDAVLHVAGIAHNSSDPKLKDLYYQVNRDLTIDTAKKAKADSVKQFIYLSSMIVFGSKHECITPDTKPDPDNFYGDSKLQGELGILPLQDENFKIAIVRPPMVYGPGCKGNFPKLVKLAKITPIFPDYDNKRSMIYVDNLMIVLQEIVDQEREGYIHPQNSDYVKTSELVKMIAEIADHKLILTSLFNPLIRLLANTRIIKKVFGNLYYAESLANDTLLNFKETISRSIEEDSQYG